MLIAGVISEDSIITATILGVVMAVIIYLLYRAMVLYINEKPYKEIFTLSILRGGWLSFSLIVIFSIIISNILLYKFGLGLKLYVSAIFAYAMLLLAAIDFKTQILPDLITKPLIVLGLVQGYFGVFTDIQSSVLGAFVGYFVLWSVNTVFRMVRGMDGMGYGDFKLLSAIGAWAGVKMLPLTILFSSIVGIFVALIIIKMTRQDMQAPTPFGPSLVLTGFIAFLYGNEVLSWYMAMLQFH